MSFAGFSSPAHPLNVGVSYFLPCQHFFTLCILSLEVLVNPNGFNYHLSLSFSDLHPWSVSFTLERYIHLPVGMSFSISLLKNEHYFLLQTLCFSSHQIVPLFKPETRICSLIPLPFSCTLTVNFCILNIFQLYSHFSIPLTLLNDSKHLHSNYVPVNMPTVVWVLF